jgi:hypothetical protein
MHGADEMCMQNFSRKLEDEANHSEYIGAKGRILLKKVDFKDKEYKDVVWICLARSSPETICCIGNFLII